MLVVWRPRRWFLLGGAGGCLRVSWVFCLHGNSPADRVLCMFCSPWAWPCLAAPVPGDTETWGRGSSGTLAWLLWE